MQNPFIFILNFLIIYPWIESNGIGTSISILIKPWIYNNFFMHKTIDNRVDLKVLVILYDQKSWLKIFNSHKMV